jgi:hypothetical protein
MLKIITTVYVPVNSNHRILCSCASIEAALSLLKPGNFPAIAPSPAITHKRQRQSGSA